MSRVLIDSLTHAYAKCENHHLCSINDHFSKTKAFCFINQNPLDKLQYSLVFTKSSVFLWVENFRGFIAGFAPLPTLSRTFIAGYLCLTKNTGFFTRGGIYPFLLYLTHVFFISFFFYATVRLILDIAPFYRAHHRTPNIVSIYQPCTHNHLMRCPRAYAMQDSITCYIMSMHNECYMDNTTTYRCHGQSHHLHITSINHFIHVNLSCKHISTFAINMSLYDQAMTHISKPCNGHCT